VGWDFKESPRNAPSRKIAAYQLHSSNMSGNIPAVLSATLEVLERQKVNLRTGHERQSYTRGGKI
jgi:hypothetical protein